MERLNVLRMLLKSALRMDAERDVKGFPFARDAQRRLRLSTAFSFPENFNSCICKLVLFQQTTPSLETHEKSRISWLSKTPNLISSIQRPSIKEKREPNQRVNSKLSPRFKREGFQRQYGGWRRKKTNGISLLLKAG